MASVDLHVVQRHEHGFKHGRLFEVVMQMLADGDVVGEAHEGIHADSSREEADPAENLVVFYLLQVFVALQANTRMETCHDSIPRRRNRVPRRHVHWAGSERFGRKGGWEVGVKRGETRFTDRAFEEDHTSEYQLNFKHAV